MFGNQRTDRNFSERYTFLRGFVVCVEQVSTLVQYHGRSVQFLSFLSFHSSCRDKRRLDDLIDRSFIRSSSFRYFSGTRVSVEAFLGGETVIVVVETADFFFDGDDVDDRNNEVPASPVPRRLFFEEVDEDGRGKSSTPVGE